MKKIIFTDTAPAPQGPYSQAVVHNDLVYVSGQLGIDPDNPGQPAGDIAVQTGQALENLDAILTAAGSGRANILKVTLYISDMGRWGEVNEVYAGFFGDTPKPARSAVPIKELPAGYLIEVDAVAHL